MKLWDKGISTDKKIEQFTIGKDRELDPLLARWDVLGSLAHIEMLGSVGLLDEDDLASLRKELVNIHESIVSGGKFEIEEGVEDVHSQVELMLTRTLGEAGKKIHSGRSRNDQVLVDLKLYLRHEIQELTERVKQLFNSLQSLSEKHRDVLMPGYTHLQVAMPSSFGLWFGAWAEGLSDDLHLLGAAWKVANQNPLGSAAGYGSSFPLDRSMTTRLLGFEDLSYNVVYAQMGRGKTEKTLAFAMSSVAATLGRFAMDICLYMGQNFRFLSFPKELTTGSSIMPHKNNPDVFELMRGKCNRIQALPNTLGAVLANLPAGYHRDLQLLKEDLFPAIEDLKDCLDIFDYAINQVEVKQDILHDTIYDYLFSVEEVNREVLKDVPFRDAYKKVGQRIQSGEYTPDRNIKHTHEGSIGNLCNDKIREKFDKAVGEMGFEEVGRALMKLVLQ